MNQQPSGGETVEHIRTMIPSLAPAERRIADAIMTNPQIVVSKTITQLADLANTSETTVVRFCRRAGFDGYPQLRLSIAGELGGDRQRGESTVAPGTDIGRGDTLEELVRKVAHADARAIEDTVEHLDVDQLDAVIDAIAAARRIGLFGMGASGFAAADLQHKLLRIDHVAHAITDSHLALASTTLMTSDDVAIGLSHSGQTQEVVECLRQARAHGATTIGIVNYPRTPVTEHCDLVVTTAARETRFRSGAMASRIAQLAIVDCVFLGVAQRSYDQTLAALRRTHQTVHPEIGS